MDSSRKYNFNCNDSLDICQRNSNIKYSNVFNSAFNQKTSRSNNNNQSEVYSSQNLAARVENSKYFDPITLFTQDYPKGLVILGLVDSGSQISLISEQLFKRLKLNEDCSDKIYISDLSQSKTESCPIICDINYRGIKWPCKFYIVDKLKDVVKSHILIGWDIIDNIRNMVGNFDFPTEKYYLPPRTYGKGILPKLVPNNEKVLRDFRETQGDFFKTARKNNISISRVYKIIMNSGDYLGESPYIFMNRINPDWFSEVLDHYNDLTDSIVIMHRADPLENPDYRSDFKVIEKAREPTKAPISEILDYFEEVSNFDDVADKFDITDDQIIDTLKAAKGIREDESLINYILKVSI